MFFLSFLAISLNLSSFNASAYCSRFTGSTTLDSAGPIAQWRTDYPEDLERDENNQLVTRTPWTSIDFTKDTAAYMDSVLSVIKTDFHKDGDVLKRNKEHRWWMSLWMDYTRYGREPRMGLTKERGPNEKDLSKTSRAGYQVWAVGFYNEFGALTFGEIFEDPCNPSVPVAVNFARNTVSIKFLFTDAAPNEVEYLKGGPVYKAMIDPNHNNTDPKKRIVSELRLIQLDIAIKDTRADETNWIFGTFGWVGPAKGDGLFDNLVPVSLQWGNDPGVYDDNIKESWINPVLHEVMYGWPERPTLGFKGRANGPADNIRSSCLSCHATARSPPPPKKRSLKSSRGLRPLRYIRLLSS